MGLDKNTEAIKSYLKKLRLILEKKESFLDKIDRLILERQNIILNRADHTEEWIEEKLAIIDAKIDFIKKLMESWINEKTIIVERWFTSKKQSISDEEQKLKELEEYYKNAFTTNK